jgi:hypothetical protein
MDMNLAITTTSARTWKAVKAHYLVAIAGAALAISSVAGAASLSIDWGDGDSVISRPVPPVAVSEDQKYVTYYIVGSEAERDLVIARESEDALARDSSGAQAFDYTYFVVVAGTSEEALIAERDINVQIADLSEHGAQVRLIDQTR